MCFGIEFSLIWVRKGLAIALNVLFLLISDICCLVGLFLSNLVAGGGVSRGMTNFKLF